MDSKQDFDVLLNRAIEFAQQCLEKYDGFIAFAGATKVNGAGAAIAADPRKQPMAEDSDEEVDDEVVKAMLLDSLRKEASSGELRATFICYDTNVRDENGEETSVIAISLEHKDGRCGQIYLPYCKMDDGHYGYADLISVPAKPQIFVKR